MSIVLDGTTGITTPDGDVYAEGNILGTVSQSGGVPTGAIIESGSNANGEFVKYADGTMICWNYAAGAVTTTSGTGSIFRSASDTTWTFPASFSVAPTCSGQADSASVRWLLLNAPSETSVSFRHAGPVSSAAEVQTRLMAIGRWF
jgi:phage baseplate assembly protein gpV